jgi:hypothetical protein
MESQIDDGEEGACNGSAGPAVSALCSASHIVFAVRDALRRERSALRVASFTAGTADVARSASP